MHIIRWHVTPHNVICFNGLTVVGEVLAWDFAPSYSSTNYFMTGAVEIEYGPGNEPEDLEFSPYEDGDILRAPLFVRSNANVSVRARVVEVPFTSIYIYPKDRTILRRALGDRLVERLFANPPPDGWLASNAYESLLLEQFPDIANDLRVKRPNEDDSVTARRAAWVDLFGSEDDPRPMTLTRPRSNVSRSAGRRRP